jgi:asparagine synthase (glutamine-hydrolysing)
MAYRYQPGSPKHILRNLLARHVPREMWDVPKHGFDFPLRDFLIADDFQLPREYLNPDRWRQTGLLSPDEVWSYARRFMAGEPGLEFRVWALAALAAWLETHPV